MNELYRFVDENVIEIVRNSTTYRHVRNSKDHIDFRDITIKQWDSVTGAILCYLKGKYRKEFLFTQIKLYTIAKMAAIDLLKKENRYLPGKING
jgi:hypothetical protein